MSIIAILGGGKIGEALVAGLVSAGHNPSEIRVTNRSVERGAYLSSEYGVQTLTDNTQACAHADVVFVCVKPPAVSGVIGEIAGQLDSHDEDTVVVSMAAGVSISALEQHASAGMAIIRAMPNTPMLIGQGVTAIAAGRFVTEAQQHTVQQLLETVGIVVPVAESQMDAVTAMSGSSPAYLFLFAEAMIDAGVRLGLPRELASQLATGSLAGAADLILQTQLEPSELRADVCSPGGTTIEAIRVFEDYRLRSAVFEATKACAGRSAELGLVSAPKAQPE